MRAACNFVGCTVSETGTCALERDPATCEHRLTVIQPVASDEDTFPAPETEGIGAPVLEQPSGNASFPSSRTLGPNIVSDMMGSRYVTVVGILGDPNAGKTACLASLYLMVANAQLEGWTFADSRSLMAFEDISRGARDWDAGQPPEQMTLHTEMSDDRHPGFLHLRLVRKTDGYRLDLALPDLPGEWTTQLVETSRSDRFEFMKAAQTIWFMVDGRALSSKERRQGAILRVGQLAERLKTMFDGHVPRLIIVVTHRDAGPIPESASNRLTTELARRQVVATIVTVASFSDDAAMRPGFGIAELVDATTRDIAAVPTFWPDSPPQEDERSYLSFRRDS